MGGKKLPPPPASPAIPPRTSITATALPAPIIHPAIRTIPMLPLLLVPIPLRVLLQAISVPLVGVFLPEPSSIPLSLPTLPGLLLLPVPSSASTAGTTTAVRSAMAGRSATTGRLPPTIVAAHPTWISVVVAPVSTAAIRATGTLSAVSLRSSRSAVLRCRSALSISAGPYRTNRKLSDFTQLGE